MAGFIIPGQRYQDPTTGQWGTAQEHAERKRQQSIQQPYAENAPSAGAANKAAQQVNPNLNYTVGPAGQTTVSNQSAMDRMLEELRAKQAATAAQAGYTNQTNQAQLQARLAAEAAKGAHANQVLMAQLQAQLAGTAAKSGYKNQADQTRLQADLAAKAAAQQQAWRESDRASLLGLINGGPGGGTPGGGFSVPPVTYGGVTPGAEEAARAGAFARAKDRTGALAASQLRGVQGEMAGRGLSGSPIEALRSAGVLGGARGGLDAVIQSQLDSELARQAQLADLQYQGGITQRGQDLGQKQALLALFGKLY